VKHAALTDKEGAFNYKILLAQRFLKVWSISIPTADAGAK